MAFVYNQLTGQMVYVPDNSRAGLMAAQAQQPVLGPNGLMAGEAPVGPAPGDPARAAAMQAQAQVPVTTPVVPAVPQTDALGQIVSGVNQASLGVVGSAIAAPASGVRRALVGLAGGDVNSLGAPLTDQTFGLVNQGIDNIQQGASTIAQGAKAGFLNLLGAQPAPPAVTPPTTPVAPQQLPAPTPVAAPAPLAPAPVPAVAAPDPVVPVAPAPVPARLTSFNSSNTATNGTQGGVNNGISMGFGPGNTAQDVLQHYALQDQLTKLNQNAAADRLNQASIISHINDPFTSIQNKKLLTQQLGLVSQQANASAALAQNAQTGILNAQTNRADSLGKNQSAQVVAQLDAAAKLGAAGITGNFGLQSAQARANGVLGAAQIGAVAKQGESRKNLAEAQLAETQLAAGISQFGADGNLGGLIANLKSGQLPQTPVNPITGYQPTPANTAIANANELLNLQAQQAALKKKLGLN